VLSELIVRFVARLYNLEVSGVSSSEIWCS